MNGETNVTEQAYRTDDAKWQAVAERDPRAEGRFVYAVRTTRVYCRPTCPSRRPLPRNVVFFDAVGQARAAGYRACRRCQPDGEAAEAAAVAQVRRLLDEAESPLTLAALGEAAGYSPTHLQKLFKRVVGVSPHRYAATARAERLRADLRAGLPVTEAGYAAGYGSSRAVYQGAREVMGMTPGAYRRGGAGQTIRYVCFSTPVGAALLAATERGVCALRFGEPAALLAELYLEFPRAALHADEHGLGPYVDATQQLLAGAPWPAGLGLDPQGTAFQRRVWEALRQIPRGVTRTYGEVASAIGQPAAVRAVGSACAKNPLAVVTPCHRVVAAGGRLGGYRWGTERKQALLAMETAEESPVAPAQELLARG